MWYSNNTDMPTSDSKRYNLVYQVLSWVFLCHGNMHQSSMYIWYFCFILCLRYYEQSTKGPKNVKQNPWGCGWIRKIFDFTELLRLVRFCKNNFFFDFSFYLSEPPYYIFSSDFCLYQISIYCVSKNTLKFVIHHKTMV